MKVMTAQRLADGSVVYLDSTGAWVDRLDDAHAVAGKAEAGPMQARAEADFKARRIVDAYLIDVRVADGHIRPLNARERIRAAGPTVRRDLGKQAEGAA